MHISKGIVKYIEAHKMNHNKLAFNRGRVVQEIMNQKFLLKLDKPDDKVFKIAAVKLLREDEVEYVNGCFQTTSEIQEYCRRTWKNHTKAMTAAVQRKRKRKVPSNSISVSSVSVDSMHSSQELLNNDVVERVDELKDKLNNM